MCVLVSVENNILRDLVYQIHLSFAAMDGMASLNAFAVLDRFDLPDFSNCLHAIKIQN
jgi:hypothetical protein